MGSVNWSSICVVVMSIASVCGRSSGVMMVATPGARQKIAGAQNNSQLQNLAKFAVDQHNAKQNSSLVYVRLVSAEQQVVAGIMYYIVLEAAGRGGVTKVYEAKVWVKPWLNFKSLEGFKEIKPTSGAQPHAETINPDGISASGDGEVSMPPLSSNDAVVKEAAEQALKTLQERSNSLAPYELVKVVSVHAHLHGDSTSYDLMLITQRGLKEERIDAEVVRTSVGAWTVKDVHLHH